MDIYMTHGRVIRGRLEEKTHGRFSKQRDNGRGIDLPKFFSGTYINSMNF